MKKKSVASYYLVAVLWLVWAFKAPLYAPRHFVIVAVLSVVVWFLGKLIWPDRGVSTAEAGKQSAGAAQPAEQVSKVDEEKTSTGNAELDELLNERDRAVGEMRRLNGTIADEKISAQIDQLEATTKKIIDQVVAYPNKLPQIKKFMNYYLPTTLKLLNAYDRMDSAGVSGVNIDGTKGKIEDMMALICAAFDKQLDALFGEEALDISTDITVLERMLAQEGIGGMQITEQ